MRGVYRALIGSFVVAAGMIPGPAGGVSAQSVESSTRVWLSASLGVVGARGYGAEGAGMLSLNVQKGSHYAVARATSIGGQHTSVEDVIAASVEELGLLYGRRNLTSWGHTAVGGGLALVDEKVGGKTTIGLPLVAEVALQATNLGLGLQAFGNLNTASSFVGVAVTLQVGWMR